MPVLLRAMLLVFPMSLAAGLAWPTMEVSATAIDFGLVPLGASATGVFTVTNGGDLPMGLRAEIASYPEADFTYSWNQSVCDDGTALRPGVERQVGGNQGDWTPPDSGGEDGEPGAEAILPPGCAVTFNVAVAPTDGNTALAALTLTTSGNYPHGRSDFQRDLTSYAEDPLELRQVVALTATTDGVAPADAEPALLAIDASPDVCRVGENVAVQAWAMDPDGDALLFTWGVDTPLGHAAFDDVYSPSTTFTCPEVEAPCGYSSVLVYLFSQDESGHQAWGQTKVWAIGSGREHAEGFVEGQGTCDPPAAAPGPPGPERPCECGESAAALPLGVLWAIAWRRRRRPLQIPPGNTATRPASTP